MTRPCAPKGPNRTSAGTSRPIRSTYTGSRAEHVMSGAPIIVAIRSRADGRVRVAMMPGIGAGQRRAAAPRTRVPPVRPWPSPGPSGRRPGPGTRRPPAARSCRNSRAIWGRKTSTPPTPPISAPDTKSAHRPGRQVLTSAALPERAEEALHQVLQRRGDGEHDLEEGVHRHEEHDAAPDGVQQDRVHPAGAPVELGQLVRRPRPAPTSSRRWSRRGPPAGGRRGRPSRRAGRAGRSADPGRAPARPPRRPRGPRGPGSARRGRPRPAAEPARR